jgi:hypothetical protein
VRRGDFEPEMCGTDVFTFSIGAERLPALSRIMRARFVVQELGQPVVNNH